MQAHRIRQDDQASLRDALVVHPLRIGRVVILEYEVHGTILSSGAPMTQLISVITMRKKDHPLERLHGLSGCLDALNSR